MQRNLEGFAILFLIAICLSSPIWLAMCWYIGVLSVLIDVLGIVMISTILITGVVFAGLLLRDLPSSVYEWTQQLVSNVAGTLVFGAVLQAWRRLRSKGFSRKATVTILTGRIGQELDEEEWALAETDEDDDSPDEKEQGYEEEGWRDLEEEGWRDLES